MFDRSYPFERTASRKGPPYEPYQTLHTYKFTGKNRLSYTVYAEQYEGELYAIKYFLTQHRQSADKYRLLTGQNDMQGIVRTCINIMLDIFRNQPYASFGFVGMAGEQESEANTQRYRIYRYVMHNFFSPLQFHHYQVEAHSLYLLLNVHAPLDISTLSAKLKQWYLI